MHNKAFFYFCISFLLLHHSMAIAKSVGILEVPTETVADNIMIIVFSILPVFSTLFCLIFVGIFPFFYKRDKKDNVLYEDIKNKFFISFIIGGSLIISLPKMEMWLCFISWVIVFITIILIKIQNKSSYEK